ncbi:galactoside alpha-(1,2)-fucosyltransferase 2-like isoform X2 [Penaeus indicus]|uniref:galactoside alpha-(1,2)-fucosyltransferase 2-like isoform X2 n=1 Tax=Penaeus indicus TaxID=29960 RepID=UPI00300DB6D2
MSRRRIFVFFLLVLNLYFLYKSDVLMKIREKHALCTPRLLFTSSSIGRLGNIMGEYATLWGLGRAFNVSVLLHPDMEGKLLKIFPYLSMDRLPASCKRGWTTLDKTYKFPKNQSLFESAAVGLLGPGKFMLGDNPVKVHLFHPFREDLIRELTFSPSLRKQANDILTHVKRKVKTKSPEITFVGVHIRRTDYIKYIKKYNTTIPSQAYYVRAMKYYREKYSHPVFIMASDDPKYCKKAFKTFKDVVVIQGNRELDMATLAACNHSIISVGSFSFWTGYLSGGEVVYPNKSYSLKYLLSPEYVRKSHLDFFTPLDE